MNSKHSGKGKVLRGILLFEVVCLVAQFILGMFANLFVQFPNSLPNGNAWSWAMSHSTVLYAHIVLGTAIVLLSLVLLGLSIAYRRAFVITLPILGLLMVILAWLSGDDFLARGQQNTSSFTMAIGFIGALVFYMGEYYALLRHRSSV